MSANIERRFVTSALEARAGGVSSRGSRLVGYASLFDVETEIAGLFRERIAPGAFDRAIRSDDVRALLNHDASLLLGRTRAGTLRLSADRRGLRYDVDLPDTTTGRDLAVLVGRGDISQSSFAFSVDRSGDEEWVRPQGALPLRIIRRASLYDVSPVTYPAYESTTVELARSAEALQQSGDVDANGYPILHKTPEQWRAFYAAWDRESPSRPHQRRIDPRLAPMYARLAAAARTL